MLNHLKTVHPDVVDSNELLSAYQYFEMIADRVDRDPLRRIVREAVKQRRILDHEDYCELTLPNQETMHVSTILMNSKEEFYLPKLVHLYQQ